MKNKLKTFIIKLIAVTISVIIIINVTYNTILAERMEKIDNFLSIFDRNNKDKFKDKIRKELNSGLSKDNILKHDDKILIYKLYLKLKKEFSNINEL